MRRWCASARSQRPTALRLACRLKPRRGRTPPPRRSRRPPTDTGTPAGDTARSRAARRASDVAPPPPPSAHTAAALGAAAAALLLVLAALAWWQWTRAAPDWVDAATASPAPTHAEHADGPRLLGEAIAYDNAGDRARARAPAGSPARQRPAHALAGDAAGAVVGRAGDARSADQSLVARMSALRRWAIPTSTPCCATSRPSAAAARDVIRYAGAVLDLRHDAWRMYRRAPT